MGGQRVFRVAAAFSVAGCLASVAMYARSASHEMSVARSVDGENTFMARTDPVEWALWISFRHAPKAALPAGAREPVLSLSAAPAGRTVYVPGTTTYSWSLPGVKYESGPVESGRLWVGGQLVPPSGDTFRQISVHWWLTILLTSLGPLAGILRIWRTWNKRPEGFCGSCGYDLRASRERCPECGTPIPKTVPATNRIYLSRKSAP